MATRESGHGSYLFEYVLVFICIFTFLISIGSLFGCKTCEPEIIFKPEVVEVPIQVPPPPIVVDGQPEWESVTTDESDWLEYIRAVTTDLLNAWSHIEYLEWKIRNHNEAISE